MLATTAEYQAKVERAGLAFRAVRPSFADMERTLGMNRRQLTAAVLARGDFLFRRLIVPQVRVSYEDMLPVVAAADIVVTSSLAFGARFAAERCSKPWVGVVLQPLMFLSAFDPPVIPGVPWLSGLLRALGTAPTRVVLRTLSAALGSLLRPLRELRRQIGLPPGRGSPLFEGQFSRSGGAVGLYSDVLGAVQPDYPRPVSIGGFAWYDSADGGRPALPPGLGDFLDAGPRPLVFTLGSLVVNSPGGFFQDSVAAARILGRRAVLLVGEEALEGGTVDPGPRAGSPDVHVCAYAPHSLLFPRAAAIVHQGGIGTLGQALRAGRPQLIVPHYADQADNADRAVRLGTARALAAKRYDAAAAARELAALLGDARPATQAADIAARIGHEDGAGRAARFILDRIESPVPNPGELR